MSSQHKDNPLEINTSQLTIAIIVADFNPDITQELHNNCQTELIQKGVPETQITIFHVPGAFELPWAAQEVITHQKPDAVICLGSVIRGETSHYDYVCEESARGIQTLMLQTHTPIIFGVLTTENKEQAQVRASKTGKNKGAYCANAAISLLALSHQIK